MPLKGLKIELELHRLLRAEAAARDTTIQAIAEEAIRKELSPGPKAAPDAHNPKYVAEMAGRITATIESLEKALADLQAQGDEKQTEIKRGRKKAG